MNTTNLPTEDLKKFGIITDDNNFSKKLTADDVIKFLQGYTIIADNDKNRATFQLVENNSKLKVILLERDKDLSAILENSKNKIQYSDVKNISENSKELDFEKKAFLFDKKTNSVKEYDFIKNSKELTKVILERKDESENNIYKIELQKLKGFLQDKIDKYPEIAKEITNDINIISKEIDSVNSISPDEKQLKKESKMDIQLDVNDPDLYEDANRIREELEEQEEEKSRGFRR